jgi:hypothetical protein
VPDQGSGSGNETEPRNPYAVTRESPGRSQS